MLTRRETLSVVGASALATSCTALPAIAGKHPDAELLVLGERFFETELAGCELDRLRDEVECAVQAEYPERPSIYQQVRTESSKPDVPDCVRMKRWGSLTQRSLNQFYGGILERLDGPRWAERRVELEKERDEQQRKLDAYEATCRAIDERHNVPAGRCQPGPLCVLNRRRIRRGRASGWR